MHIHGGGWVLDSEKSSDIYLQKIADSCGLICLSVGYRLAPEFPYPAATEDCYDAAEWLVDNSNSVFDVPLGFIGGESAGANLAVLAVLHLAKSVVPRYANFRMLGLLAHYGVYSLQWLPRTRNFKRDPPLVLDKDILDEFREAYLPGHTSEDLASPEVSPLYGDFAGLSLPPALFTCGTEDCLLDDSVYMTVKWKMAGNEAIFRAYLGSPHGFTMFTEDVHENTRVALKEVHKFVEHAMIDRDRSLNGATV